jgi:hypothetical protein
MERSQVITVLESLASGVDPTTGVVSHEVFAAPNVIRALFVAADLLKRTPAPATATQKQQPPAAGARWTSDEDAVLAREFDQGTSIAEIASRHSRTRGAITSRLVKLGRIDASTVRLRDRGAAAHA